VLLVAQLKYILYQCTGTLLALPPGSPRSPAPGPRAALVRIEVEDITTGEDTNGELDGEGEQEEETGGQEGDGEGEEGGFDTLSMSKR